MGHGTYFDFTRLARSSLRVFMYVYASTCKWRHSVQVIRTATSLL